MIGIGAKDDIYMIQYVKKNWKVQFPLFTDEDRTIHELVGEPPTPYFIIVKIKEKGELEIIHTHLGKIPAVDKFIHTIMDKAGLNL